jgi:hypothetical protein
MTSVVDAPAVSAPWLFPRRRGTVVFTLGMALAVVLARVSNPFESRFYGVAELSWFEANRRELALVVLLLVPVAAAVVAVGRHGWARGAATSGLLLAAPVLVFAGTVPRESASDTDEWGGLAAILLALAAVILTYPFALSLVTRSWSVTVPVLPLIAGIASFFLGTGFLGFVLAVGAVHLLLQRERDPAQPKKTSATP